MRSNVPISKRLILVNSASGVAAHLLSVTVLVWLQQYLLKRVPADEYALYPVIASVVAFVPIFSSILTAGLGRYAVEAYAKNDTDRITEIVSTMFPLLLLGSLGILTIGGILSWHIDSILTIPVQRIGDARMMMGVMFLILALQLATAPFQVGMYVRQKFVLHNVIRVASELLRIGVLFALLFGISTRILWIVVASAVSTGVYLLAVQYASRRLIPALRFRISAIRWAAARELTGFGVWSFVAHVAEYIRANSDPIIQNKLATPMGVTCYYLGSLPAKQIAALTSQAINPVMPALTAMHATGAEGGLRSAFLRVGRYSLWTALFIGVPILVYAKEIVLLYVGPLFLDSATVAVLMVSTLPLAFACAMIPNIAIAKGVVRPMAIRVIVMQGFNLVVTLFFVGVLQMGSVGSALGTFVTYWVMYPLVLLPFGLRIVGVTLGDWLRQTVMPGFIPALVSGLVMWVLREVFRPESWAQLGCLVACGGIVYVGLLLGFCLSGQDRQELARLLSRGKHQMIL